jgi:hypothetical protein
MTRARFLAFGLGCALKTWSAISLTGFLLGEGGRSVRLTWILVCAGCFVTNWTRLSLVPAGSW